LLSTMTQIVNSHIIIERIGISMILTPSHTSVYIVNNTAVQHGGVILADEVCKEGQYLVTTHRLMLEL